MTQTKSKSVKNVHGVVQNNVPAVQSSEFGLIKSDQESRIQKIKDEFSTPLTNSKRNLAFAGLMLFGLLFLGTIAFQLISGVIALFVTVVFGAASWFILRNVKKFDKLIAQKVKNYVLEQQIKEAKENGMIQLKNYLLDRKNQLKSMIDARSELGGYMKKLESKLQNSDPDKDMYYKQKEKMFQSVTKAYDNNYLVIKNFQKSVQALEEKIYYYNEMEEFTHIANKIASSLDTNELDEMLSLEAFSAIDTDFCNAFAQLDTSIEFADI